MAEAGANTKKFPIRTFFWSVVLVGVGVGSLYSVDQLVVRPRRAEERRLKEQLAAQQERIQTLERRKAQLKRFVARLKQTERRAQVVVLNQTKDKAGRITTTFRFTEVNAQGTPVSPSREFTVPGEEVYFDRLVIKFEDGFIENGAALKGKALMIFRRIFTDKLKPEDGYWLDKRGLAPEIYASKEAPSAFERDLWARFWELAEHPEQAHAKGIRAIHGDAVYQRLKKDTVYLLELRASGELSIRPALALAK